MAHVEQWVSCTDTHGVEVHGDYAGTVQLEGRTFAIVVVREDEPRVVLVDPAEVRIEQAVFE